MVASFDRKMFGKITVACRRSCEFAASKIWEAACWRLHHPMPPIRRAYRENGATP